MRKPEARSQKPEARSQKSLAAHLLRGLHAEWRKLSPNLDIEPLEGETPKDAERRVRLQWTNEMLARGGPRGRPGQGQALPLQSWSELSQGQAKYLLKKMRAELGETPLNDYIARAAVRLFGANWDEALADRIRMRFHVGPEISTLAFWQKKALFEELVRRIAAQGSGIGDQGLAEGKTPNPNPKTLNPNPSLVEAVRMEIVRQKL